MSYGAAASLVASQAGAIARAIKASGAIVNVDPDNFNYILARNPHAVVIIATGGFVTKNYQYLTAYKGFVFYTKSKTALALPADAELIAATKIWVPG